MSQCISANEDSLTLRKDGKLLDARRALAACAATACPEAIQRACRGRMTDLNNGIPSVVFEVKDTAGADLVDARVSVDGQATAPVPLTAMELDPGPHVFRFGAPGQAAVESSIVLREGEKDHRVTVVFLGNPPSPGRASLEMAEPGGGARAASPPGEASARPTAARGPMAGSTEQGAGQRTAGWIVGGTGIAAMAAGGILGLVAKASYDSAPGCVGSGCSTQGSVNTRMSARDLGNVATGIVAAGATLTAAGVIVWLTAPRGRMAAQDPAWRAGLTLGGPVVEGEF